MSHLDLAHQICCKRRNVSGREINEAVLAKFSLHVHRSGKFVPLINVTWDLDSVQIICHRSWKFCLSQYK